jgi:glycosyltransferase involved in cell wall biosynthesis
MPKISGFTIVRNAVKLDFPLEASLHSILPICDEVVVNVGRSDDETLDLVRAIADPKIRIIETEWDFGLKSRMLAEETQRAMRACRYPWGVYIQADEVLHERGAAALRAAIERHDADRRVEGLLVKYMHFYGDMDTIAVNRRWYRREVRAVRLDPACDVRSFRDAQGFRVGPNHRKIRARLTEAEMFHYGWARPTQALHAKREANSAIWGDQRRDPHRPLLSWFPGLRRFQGTHPVVARPWVDARREDAARRVGPPHFRPSHLRYYASDVIERLTGARVFEFRNYELVR